MELVYGHEGKVFVRANPQDTPTGAVHVGDQSLRVARTDEVVSALHDVHETVDERALSGHLDSMAQ